MPGRDEVRLLPTPELFAGRASGMTRPGAVDDGDKEPDAAGVAGMPRGPVPTPAPSCTYPDPEGPLDDGDDDDLIPGPIMEDEGDLADEDVRGDDEEASAGMEMVALGPGPGKVPAPMLYSVRRILRESAPLLCVCILLETLGGQMLNSKESLLVAVPLMLMAIPVINGVGGNIGTVLGMRFTSALHLGEITPTLKGSTLKSNLLQGLALGIIAFGTLTFVTVSAPFLLGFDPGIDPWHYAMIMFGAGLMLTSLVVLITVVAAVYSFRFGYDPDNVVTPVVTTTTDLMGITSLLAIMTVVGVG